ncbi:MAG: sensor histidine kinase [Bacteroidales bacterium]|jgi:signal transduction histidine kinase|nr:sensor histidine kinase [Bacteroidales bacterium]
MSTNFISTTAIALFLLTACNSKPTQQPNSMEQQVHIANFLKDINDPDTLLLLADRYLQEGDKPSAIKTFRKLGKLNRDANNFYDAIQYHSRGLAIAQDIGDIDEIILFYNQLGTDYRRMGAYEEASTYHYRALQTCELYKDKTSEIAIKNRVIALNGIGIVHLMLENFDDALPVLYSALEGEIQLGSHLGMAINYANIGSIYEKWQLYDSARTYYEHSMANNRIIGSQLGISLCHNHFGRLAEISGNYDEALKEYYAAYEIMSEISDRWHWMVSCLAIIRVYLAKGDLEAAETYIKCAEAVAYELKSSDHLSALYEMKHTFFEKKGDFRRAHDSYKESKRYLDSTLNLKNVNHLNNLRVHYETSKRETEIAALKTEKQLMFRLNIYGSILLILILIIFLFLWNWIVQKKRFSEQQVKQLEQEKQLVATQALLDGETQERTRIARDLHDGLGSLLSAVKLNLNQTKKNTDLKGKDLTRFDETLKMLDNSISEMRHIAHHLMPDVLSRFGLKTALTDFCNSIPIVEFNYFGDEKRLSAEMEVIVYRIAHELINNALKHSEASQIVVQIVQESDRLMLTVEDNGKGFDLNTTPMSMGLTNIRTRTASFGGLLDIRTEQGKGTEINIQINLL